MPLAPGSRLGPYEIVSALGAGGMGEVYRARDHRLGRDVALKILPGAFAADVSRAGRFEREARVLASLNHPNIATLHGFEEADGVRFLVMELVAGETLAQRLRPGPMPFEETLPIFQQIAEGLEAAHEAGVVHRDLKPGNVMVTPEGRVKILDFGLAKPFLGGNEGSSDISHSPTITAIATQRGEVMGTVAYMSPEQARGKPVDRRTDIWAFGCVLFEALTGRRPFPGETTTDIMAAIVKDEPDWSLLPASLPPSLTRLLRRTMEKDPRSRLRDIGEARVEMARVATGADAARSGSTPRAIGSTEAPASSEAQARTAAARRPAWRAVATLGATALAGAAVTFAVMTWRDRGPTPSYSSDVLRLTLEAPAGLLVGAPRLSPDGRAVLYYGSDSDSPGATARKHLHIRSLGRWESHQLEGTEGAVAATFSPDGRWLAVVAPVSPSSSNLRLIKIPVDGSAPPLTIADWSDALDSTILWLPDGDIVAGRGSPSSLLRIRSDGSGKSTSVPVAGVPPRVIKVHDVLPDGRRLLATAPSWEGGGYHDKTFIIDSVTGESQLLIEEGSFPRWDPKGRVLFTRRDTLLAAPVDPKTGVAGAPVAIARGLRLEREDAGAWVHTSSTGALVYLPGGHAGAHRRLVVVDRQGALTPLSDEHRLPFVPPIFASPDRRRFAVAVMRENWLFAIFASEIDRPRLRLLGQGQDVDCDHPVWLPDSELLIYGCEGQTLAAGVYVAPVHGGAPKRIVAGVPGSQFRPTSVSPDGRWLLLQRDAQRSSIDLVRLDVKDREISASPGKPLLESDAPYGSGYFSTDGRWIVYASEESGRLEIFVRAFSHDGAVGPATLVGPSRNGSLLWLDPENGSQSLGFESEPGRWFSVNVTGTAVAELSNPRPAYDLSRIRPEVVPGSALPGGRLLAIQRAEEEAGARQIQLVLNISEELDRLVPVHP